MLASERVKLLDPAEKTRRILAAKVELETNRCRAKHPGKDCIADIEGVGAGTGLAFYACMFGGRPMND